ncbi:metal tolerance protein A1-like [Nymphaea colorata]|uniref:Cation efflux protein cytoplasmic domain-containing protein n=1 Tax=Nymphaea colorata TaxID=210225 RepID=A0A5K1GX96_9MAGN|nr:metal tolerance protein A1-like [Nymphaea colorata]XP_031496204.1 metal tolerance protein A1-like [Nymphaea colorata]XP_049935340.1 metal tolerance protein A1-like [Nymphaea colorata]
METPEPQNSHIVEIAREILAEKSSPRGNKFCGGPTCGLSDGAKGTDAANERSASMKKLWMAVILCLLFMTAEVVGGIQANSLAILTDAAHLLSDVAAFGISLFSMWISGWEATPRQSYGFFRVEILGTLVSIQMIWLLVGILVYEAIDRIIHDHGEVKGFWMFVVAAFGFLVNVIMAFLLGHDHGHGLGAHDHGGDHDNEHSHGPTISMHHHLSHTKHVKQHNHSEHVEVHAAYGENMNEGEHCHSEEREHFASEHKVFSSEPQSDMPEGELWDRHKATKSFVFYDNELEKPLLSQAEDSCCRDQPGEAACRGKQRTQKRWNINVHAAFLHVLGDCIQSVGVMIGGAVIWWKPQWRIIDLICTLFFSVIVLGTTIRLLRNILEVLMESTPREIDARRLEQGLCEMEEVEAVHELHIWAITVGKILLACHVKIKPEADADMVLDNVIGYIKKEHNISHVTIQIER